LEDGDEPKVGFVRHGDEEGDRFGLEPTGMYELMLDNYVALDWDLGGHPSRALCRENDSEQALKDLNTFYRFRRNGFLVFQYFPSVWRNPHQGYDPRPERVVKINPFNDETRFARIGYIQPGTAIEHIRYPKRSPRYPAANDEPSNKDEVEMRDLTGMQMTNVVEISEHNYPELFAADNLPARTSASRWRKMKEEVIEAYFDEYGI
jgi:hypothetical protein